MRHLYRHRSALWIAFGYALLGILWILLSDRLIEFLTTDLHTFSRLQTLKGWVYVLATSVLLYALIRRSQQTLQQSHNLLRQIIEGTDNAIFVKDLQGRYILLNTATTRIFGRSANAILGRSDREFWSPPSVLEEILTRDREILNSGEAQSFEEVVPVQGQDRTYLTNKYVWRDARGSIQGLIGVAKDISDRKQWETERQQLLENLQQQTQDLAALSAVTANAISTLDLDDLLEVLLGRITAVLSADAATILLVQDGSLKARCGIGITKKQLPHYSTAIGQGMAGTIATSVQPLYVEDIQNDPHFSHPLENECRTRTMLGVPLKRNGNFVGVLQMEWYVVRAQSDRQVHLLEITAERCAMAILNAQLFEKTKQLQERLQLQIDRMPIGCILCDRHLFITEWNPAAEKIFRFTKAEILGKNAIETIVPPSERSHVREILNRVARGDMNAANINKNITNDGCLITCEWSNTPLIASDGTFLGLLLMVQDITERQRANEQLRQYANYDPLTGLPRRSLLLERIKTLLAETQERDRPLFAVLHLDINRFQAIKYSLGHDIAEQLLVAMARRLEACLHPPAMLVRVEADEFAILLEAVSTSSEATRMAEQIQQAIAQPFKLNGYELFTSASIGLVLSSLPNADPEDLCQAADVAMHHAKTSGYKYVVFDRALQTQALRRLQLDADLRRALDRREFQVHYQPIVALQTLELVGFEALVRWHSPTGIVAPSEFIPLAEETGAIVPLGTWVLHQACQQMQRWQQQFSNRATLTISVNLSALQLKQLDLIEQIDWILRDTGLPARCLKLEITESALIEDTHRTINILERLKAKQIRLCVDDFGTGYSSLSYLHAFPFDTLKIDRSFISRLGDELANAEIARTIILLGKNLGMEVVAEGIETTQQMERLQRFGCEYGQGYLFARPMDAAATERAIANESWRL